MSDIQLTTFCDELVQIGVCLEKSFFSMGPRFIVTVITVITVAVIIKIIPN